MRYYGLEPKSLDSYFQMKSLRNLLAVAPPEGELRLFAFVRGDGSSALYYINDAGEVIDLSVSSNVDPVTPGGSDKNAQYNDAGAFGGVSNNATATNKFLRQVSSGTPSMEQVAAADVSGLAASATTDTTNADNITSGTLSIARIANGSVTKAKIENVAADRLLGRGNGGGAGAPQEISLGTGLSMSGTTLSASSSGSAWSVLTNGDPLFPELMFDSNGDVMMTEIP